MASRCSGRRRLVAARPRRDRSPASGATTCHRSSALLRGTSAGMDPGPYTPTPPSVPRANGAFWEENRVNRTHVLQEKAQMGHMVIPKVIDIALFAHFGLGSRLFCRHYPLRLLRRSLLIGD